jgi:hypothetical protein
MSDPWKEVSLTVGDGNGKVTRYTFWPTEATLDLTEHSVEVFPGEPGYDATTPDVQQFRKDEEINVRLRAEYDGDEGGLVREELTEAELDKESTFTIRSVNRSR